MDPVRYWTSHPTPGTFPHYFVGAKSYCGLVLRLKGPICELHAEDQTALGTQYRERNMPRSLSTCHAFRTASQPAPCRALESGPASTAHILPALYMRLVPRVPRQRKMDRAFARFEVKERQTRGLFQCPPEDAEGRARALRKVKGTGRAHSTARCPSRCDRLYTGRCPSRK